MNRFDQVLDCAIDDGVFPGACYVVWKDGELITGAVGNFTYDKGSPSVTLDTVWDLASLSKVVGTTTATMMLYQDGQLELDAPVCSVISEFRQNGKEHITFRNLLTHDSGLVAFRPYHLTCSTELEVMEAIYREGLMYETGSQCIYSDLSMIIVAEAAERITTIKLDDYLRERVFRPLGMNQTGYFRGEDHSFTDSVRRSECAPTEEMEPWRRELRVKRYGIEGAARMFGDNPFAIQGEVHDPTATRLNGVAGHAGLFSTVGDLGRFMTAFMSNDQSLVKPEVFEMFTARQGAKSSRALGWDTKSTERSSAGTTFGSKSFGHTGYTGTSIWCDPEAKKFSILLTNRVYPSSENTKILDFRAKFHELL